MSTKATLPLPPLDEIVTDWSEAEAPILSIRIPLRPSGPEVEQNHIRRKNVRREAEALLETEDIEHADKIRAHLDVLDSTDLTAISPAVGGVVWLVNADGAATRFTPHDIDQAVTLGSNAALRALLPLVGAVPTFHLLALSENLVALYRGSAAGLVEIPLEDVGSSLADERWRDDFEKTLQWHAGSRGNSDAIYHGQGGAKEHDEIGRRQFFQAVARAVHDWRESHGGPEVPFGIAAVERTASGFEEAYADAPDADFLLKGNPDDLDPSDLHEQALAALETWGDERWEKLETSYGNAIASDQADDDPLSIVRHAATGRVDTLLVSGTDPVPAERAGTGADGMPRYEIVDRLDAPVDLAEVAIALTLRSGGRCVARLHGVGDENPTLRAMLRY